LKNLNLKAIVLRWNGYIKTKKSLISTKKKSLWKKI